MATVKKVKKAQGGDSLAIKTNVRKALESIANKKPKKTKLDNKLLYPELQAMSQPDLKPISSNNYRPVAPKKDGGKVSKAKDGKWIQKATASIKKRGTAGKCTPITKPGCTGRAKALAKTFKKMAKKK
jgi:hypothetical protein